MTAKNTESGKVFLATTALEEFWDLSAGKIIFLGDWCCRYSKKDVWSKLNYEVLPMEAASFEGRTLARLYTKDLEKRIKELLTIELNKIHGEQKSYRYWSLLLEMWVHSFTSRIYDIYLSLKAAQATGLDLYTFGIMPEDYLKCKLATDEDYYMFRDDYNLQLYTETMKAMGFKIEYKKYKEPNKETIPKVKLNLKNKSITIFENIVFKITKFISKNSEVITKNSYLSPLDEIKLYIITRGRIGFLKKREVLPINTIKNIEIRQRLRIDLNNASEFEIIMSDFIRRYLPEIFVEQYKDLAEKNKNYCKATPRKILSATPWQFNNEFKFWAANMSEEGTILLGMQHGGNYGSEAFIEELELNMLDKFVTWGWSDKRNDKIVKGIATKLNSRKKKVSRNYKDILFATTVFSRFRTTFRYAVCGFAKQYQGDQIEFLSCINKDIILNLILRPHYFDAGWDTNKMITDFDSSIRFQTWDVKFQKALKECKIYVCDHLSTTFIEALYINKPTILFWRDSNHELKPEAVNYYENLKRVGILHSNPRAAAEVLNEIYEDVETWWNNHERQIAVREFCDNFAYVPPNSLEIFGEILLK